MKKILITFVLIVTTVFNCIANDHIKMCVSNCVQTNNNCMNIDLYVVNDGSTGLKLNSIAYGLNINNEIINNGILSWMFIPGTSDLPSSIVNNIFYRYNKTFHELILESARTSAVNYNSAPTLPTNTWLHIGTFTITNTNSWNFGNITNFSMQTINKTQLMNTHAIVYTTTNHKLAILNNVNTNVNVSITNCNNIILTTFIDSHITMSVSNCIQTSTTQMTVDLYIVNDGDLSLTLNNINYGLNVNAEILNGGTLSWVFVPSTSDLPIAITNSFYYDYSEVGNELELRSATGAVTSGNAPSLPFNTLIHVGTFTITNTQTWPTATTNFTLQNFSLTELTTTGADVYVNGSTFATGLFTPLNVTTSVDCTISL